ncbi:CPBP family intramembrane metalloprotease [Amycolatopsis sp. NBC_00345]|uniref:CPBP family intramembrane glutamic endopeptidase n=1 Tax=Amycolatopsis sp. NBC_00345 TaxID=2975955 RepID=UPI002E276B9D
MTDHAAEHTRRRMPVWGFVVVVLVYLALIQGLGLFLTRDTPIVYAGPTTVNELWRSITLPVGASLVFVGLVVAALRWWRPVARDDRPVRRWVLAVPVIMLAIAVLAVNYGGLADRGPGFTVLLLLSTLLVGFAEEGMFRGIGIAVFRDNGFTEAKVALWSTVVFGLAHATNLISTGPKAFVQVLVAALSGYFLYLIRRRTGGLLIPAIAHGLWDFSLISSSVRPGQGYFGPLLNVLGLVVLTIVVLVRRRHIEPEAHHGNPG